MEKFVYYNSLFLIYKNLIKEKNREIFDLYYGDNLTMQEIADLKNITKSRVGLVIKNVCKSLEEYESILHLYKYNKTLESLLEEENIDKIKDTIKIILKGE